MNKRFIKFVTILLAVALPMVFLVGCQSEPKIDGNSIAYVSLSINPSVEFAVGDDGLVEAVYAVNEDAEILIAGVDFLGMSIEDASELFVQLATEAGYIDVDETDNEVVLGVVTEDEEYQERLERSLTEKIHNFFDNKGIFGRVSQETLDMYVDQAAELGVSMGKVKMILRALDINPDLDINELKDMPMNELVSLLKIRMNTEAINASLRPEFASRRQEIVDNYTDLPILKAEIEALEIEIANFEGEAEDLILLQNSLEAKEAEFLVLREAMLAEVEAIREEALQKAAEIRQQNQIEREQRVEENREKAEAHKNRVQNNKNDAAKQVREWRNSRK